MEDLQRRTEDLIRELRLLCEEKKEGLEEIRRLRENMEMKNEEIRKQNLEIDKLNVNVAKLKFEVKRRDRRARNNEKEMRCESRRRELLNRKISRSSKMYSEYYVNLEMKMLNDRYETMKRFMIILSEKFNFDHEIFEELLKVSTCVDDPIITALIDSIVQRSDKTES